MEGRGRRFTSGRQVGSDPLVNGQPKASFLRVRAKPRIKTAEISADRDLVCTIAGRDRVDAEARKARLRKQRGAGARMRLGVASQPPVIRAGIWP
jgi:hypothetical protein